MIILIGTQIPDKDSLPTGITRNVNTRFCLSVADQTANDMILGTSAYKLGYRATVFQPVTEAGWGILRGFGKPGARRSFYVDTDQRRPGHGPRHRAARRRRHPARAAGRPATPGPAYDVLADVAAVWPRRRGRRPGTRPCSSCSRSCAPTSTAGGSPRS